MQFPIFPRGLVFAFAALLLLLGSLRASAPVAAEIEELDRTLNALISARDAKGAAALYCEEFVLTTAAGRRVSKGEILAQIVSPGLTFEINTMSGVQVRVVGATALLTGTLHQKGVLDGRAFEARLLVTDTWVRTERGWQLLAGHASKAPEAR